MSEVDILTEAYNSLEAEFIALYGRRRVGKTYLVKSFFGSKPGIFFHTTGLKDGTLAEQLAIFADAFRATFNEDIAVPVTWMNAFDVLTKEIKKFSGEQKVVIFLDELPWLATSRSRLVQALDYYWNTKWVYDPNIKLVICGSAASWMLDNIINSKGGLHNRLTRKINLKPFLLPEVKQYLLYRGVNLNNEHILELYMTMGGVPYYLKEVKAGLSAKQNISRICFTQSGLLHSEYANLLSSLFKHSEIHAEILDILSKKPGGVDKSIIAELSKYSSLGGRLSKRLDELEHAGFIKKFIPYGKKVKEVYYQLIDEYTLFYLKWIKPNKNDLDDSADNIIWEQLSLSAGHVAWSGSAFEAICYKHIKMIKRALQLDRISAKVGNWRYVPKAKSDDKGAQIDLIFDRIDKVISLCEIKYCNDNFSFDKKIYQELKHKQQVFVKETKVNKQIFWSLITSHPVKRNSYFDEIIMHNVVLAELF